MSLYMHKKFGTVARYLILSWRSNCVTGPNILCNFAPRRPACLSRPGHTRHFYLPPEKEITQNIRCVNSFFYLEEPTSSSTEVNAISGYCISWFISTAELVIFMYDTNWWMMNSDPVELHTELTVFCGLMLRKRKFKIGFANNTPSVNSIGLCLQFTVWRGTLGFAVLR